MTVYRDAFPAIREVSDRMGHDVLRKPAMFHSQGKSMAGRFRIAIHCRLLFAALYYVICNPLTLSLEHNY